MSAIAPDDPALRLWAGLLAEAGRLGPGRRFLDVGGGSGLLAAALAAHSGATGVLADPDAQRSPGITPVRARAEALPFAAESFDAVLFSHVLHHLEDPRAALREAARVLAPEGTLFVRTAAHADLRALPHARWIPHLLAGILASIPDLTHIQGWLREAGLSCIEQLVVDTPQAIPLEAYAEAVAMQAWRDWAMAPGGGPDPRGAARAWALEAFETTPPVRETLIVARQP